MSNEMKWIDHEKRWEYLGVEESKLYSAVLNSTDGKDIIIKTLLEKIARASRGAHRTSPY